MKRVGIFLFLFYILTIFPARSTARHHHELEHHYSQRRIPTQHHTDHHHEPHHQHHKKHHQNHGGSKLETPKTSSDLVKTLKSPVKGHPPLPPYGEFHHKVLSRSRREKDMKHPITTSKNVKTSHNQKDTSMADTRAPCTVNSDCSFITHAQCVNNTFCGCKDGFAFVPNVTKCFEEVLLADNCSFNEQCTKDHSICDSTTNKCDCKPTYTMKDFPGFGTVCVDKSAGAGGNKFFGDPAVIGALVGLGLMFIIICVVLRMFSKERFRENRSIFNTPNPRLMNASLFKESKLLSPARGERRGSRASVRGPSRASSIASVNKEGLGKSPDGSLAKGRRGSALSNISATGSASGTTGATPAKSSSSNPKEQQETSVAIEAVD